MKNLLLFLILFFIFAKNISAQVIINEVYPNPLSDESEWIELYNTASESADLSNWTLEDKLSSPSLIYDFGEEIIESLSFLVINLETNKLNNSADGVVLKNNLGEIIDSMDYENSQVGESWSKIIDGGEVNWILSEPSPNATNPSPMPSPSPSSSPSPTPSPTATPALTFDISNLTLSEISSCPISGESEWIEIFNNSNNLINLEDWKIRDASSNTKTINLNINANSLGLISWSSSLLNNSGDTVILESPQTQKAFEISFDKCNEKGNTFIYHDSAWRETSTATPNSANIYTNLKPDVIPEDEDTQQNVIPDLFRDLDFNSTEIPQHVQDDSKFIPPINLEGIVLGTSINSEENNKQEQIQNPDKTENLTDSRNAIANAILGGLLLASSSGYKLYEWYQKNHLQL